jgi:hypothetical protein
MSGTTYQHPRLDTTRYAQCGVRTANSTRKQARAQRICQTIIKTALATTTLMAILASGAYGGSYTIYNCPSAPGANGDPGPWTIFGAPQSNKGSCGGGLGDFIGPLGGSMSATGLDGVQVVVPAGSGITIHEARIWWFVPHQVSGAQTYALASVNAGIVGGGETPLEKAVTPEDLVLPSNTTELTLADYCSNSDASNPCVIGTAGENPDLELFGSQLTLFDSSLPTGSVTGGNLASSGTLSGTGAITFQAQDADSGVREAQLLIDGVPVASKSYAAECPYQEFAACPTTTSDEIQWSTVATSDGNHEVGLRIVSAAGNTSIIDDHSITINNQPTHTSSSSITGPNNNSNSSSAIAHTANGVPCTGEELNLEVNGQRRAPIVPYGRPVTIKGVLHCGTTPIHDAQISIATIGGPASAAISNSVQTAVDGSFSYAVPTGPDRSLQFSYTAYSNDPGPSATAIATVAIRPAIKLKINPRHTRNGHTIHWAGIITGPPYPKQGITLNVEVQEGRRWRIFEQVSANSKGEFHYKYRFRATSEPTTYDFRVSMPPNGSQGYPYASSASNTVDVHVNP